MDDAFVTRIDQELASLDRILHANYDESALPGPSGMASRCWFLFKQFRLGIAVTIAVFLFLWML
jgi:hypothetical protein